MPHSKMMSQDKKETALDTKKLSKRLSFSPILLGVEISKNQNLSKHLF